MKYTKDQLRSPDLLKEALVLPLENCSGRGIHIGIYNKEEFADLPEFCLFIVNISSLTQVWYSSGDLDEAYEWYAPTDDKAGWIDSAEKKEGKVIDWLRSIGIDTNLDRLPGLLEGTFYVSGDKEEFLIAGYNDSTYFELYLSDLIL